MQARVDRWGDSLAIRIPHPVAVQLGIEWDDEVELACRGRELVITIRNQPRSKLDVLLEGVTEENLHGEIDTGQPVGDEAW